MCLLLLRGAGADGDVHSLNGVRCRRFLTGFRFRVRQPFGADGSAEALSSAAYFGAEVNLGRGDGPLRAVGDLGVDLGRLPDRRPTFVTEGTPVKDELPDGAVVELC